MTDSRTRGTRLEAGLELRSAVETTAVKLDLPFCDVTGFGELEWVELAGTAERGTVFLQGPFQLVDLKGRVRLAGDTALLDMVCTLTRHTDNGIQTVGGILQRAKTVFVELAYVPLRLIPDELPQTAPTKSKVPKLVADSSRPDHPIESLTPPAPAPSAPPSADNRWAKAVAESNRVQKEAQQSTRSDLLPARGDIVNHRQFGRCTVVRITDAHITLRKPNNRNVQLGLPILDFAFLEKEDDKSVFNVNVIRK